MNKQELVIAIENNKRLSEVYGKQAAQLEAELAALNNPPVTGRPFAVGMNEPKRDEIVWWHVAFESTGCCCGEYDPAGIDDPDMLRRGELYPTEADCIEGNRREEIRKRYEALGRPYKKTEANICAWYSTFHQEIKMGHTEYMHAGQVYFGTKEACQAAIDTINREYGPGAFEWAMFGVDVKKVQFDG